MINVSIYNSQVNAMDVDLSGIRCIVQIGSSCNDCSHGNNDATTTTTTTNNIDNSTTVNKYDNRTSIIKNTINDSCNGHGISTISQEGENETASITQTQYLCPGLGALSLPN